MTLIPSHHLEERGWTKRFTALGLRLKESIELYRQLGYEVHLEPAYLSEEQHQAEACQQCFVTTQARTIYTRPQANVQRAIPGKE
jgi:hypothetical protein